MEKTRYNILLVHCHYRLAGGEDAVFADERAMLERHRLDVGKLWMTAVPEGFDFIENNGDQVKLE